MARSERDQCILQLERAESGHFVEIGAAHGTLASPAHPATALSWINAAVKKRKHQPRRAMSVSVEPLESSPGSGRVAAVHGSVVDFSFAGGMLPAINEAV